MRIVVEHNRRKKNIRGVFGLVFRNNYQEILLVKRRDMPIWVAPGGGIEPGEEPSAAAVREVREESGYEVKVVRQIAQYTLGNKGALSYTFDCELVGGKPQISDETCEVGFFKLRDFPEMTYPLVYSFIKDAMMRESTVIKRPMEKIPLKIWLKALTHPFVLFRYFLTKFGIHLDS